MVLNLVASGSKQLSALTASSLAALCGYIGGSRFSWNGVQTSNPAAVNWDIMCGLFAPTGFFWLPGPWLRSSLACEGGCLQLPSFWTRGCGAPLLVKGAPCCSMRSVFAAASSLMQAAVAVACPMQSMQMHSA